MDICADQTDWTVQVWSDWSLKRNSKPPFSTTFCELTVSNMKRLNATGNYINKNRAEPITQDQKNRLWELGLLGNDNAQVLLNTMVYQVGFYFALRSGNEHRRLRHSPLTDQTF